jgi:catechol 2,3-dioxygenase-like lactoylglutathione lyase family enzyme
MKIEFLATVSVIAADPPASRQLYVDALGLPLEGTADGGYHYTEKIAGFGTVEWPADRPIPQVSIEFDVADADSVQSAADELAAAGHELLHPVREEPWGQTIVRLQSLEGAVVGISYAPALHV